jgi:hypothetical protein
MPTTIAFVAPVIVFASGCGTRTVLVHESSPVRIGPDVRGRCYVMIDGEWRLSPRPVDIPEGWYLVPPSFVESGGEKR